MTDPAATQPGGRAPIELLPPSAQDAGTRRKLLETALVLFAERGYHGVSVRDITTVVGVKASSLYAHFPSKEQLLADLLNLGHAEFLAALRTALTESGAGPADELRALVDAHVRNHATYPLLARVCAEDIGGLSEENLANVLSHRLEVISLFLNAIAAGIDTGDFRRVDPFLTSMAILATGIRVANWYSGNAAGLEFGAVLTADLAPATHYSVDQISDQYVDLALHMVRA